MIEIRNGATAPVSHTFFCYKLITFEAVDRKQFKKGLFKHFIVMQITSYKNFQSKENKHMPVSLEMIRPDLP